MIRVIFKIFFVKFYFKNYRPTDRPNHRPDPTRPDFQNRGFRKVRPDPTSNIGGRCPGVGIRTKFLALSDLRPSRGPKFLACPTESRAELSDCPKIARLGSRLGSRALFRTNSDIGQPSSRDFRSFILSGQCFFLFYLIIILVGRMTLSMSLTVSSDFRPQKIASSNL